MPDTADKIILIDTSAWICYFARKGFHALKASIADLLDQNLAAITGPVLIELVQGCRTIEEKEALKEMLEGVLFYSVTDSIWRNAAELAFNLRRKGVTVSAIDAVIATTAIDNKLALLHNDSDYDFISEHTSLDIYHTAAET